MKKSLVILVLLVLSFAGNAQEKAQVEYRSYYFDVQTNFMRAIIQPSSIQWYHEMALYIDGRYKETMYIGNRNDILLTMGFSVPVGSSWEIVPVRTEATKDYAQIALSISYSSSSGQATAPGSEIISISVR